MALELVLYLSQRAAERQHVRAYVLPYSRGPRQMAPFQRRSKGTPNSGGIHIMPYFAVAL